MWIITTLCHTDTIRIIFNVGGHSINHTVTVEKGEKVTYTDCKVTETHKYRAESFKVTDELLAGNSKLTIKGLFSTSNSKYASTAGVSGLESEGWTQNGNEYIWKADESEINSWIESTSTSEDKPKTTATFYIICDVNEDWTAYKVMKLK